MTPLPGGWFDVLKHRSEGDKIALPINCAMAEPGSVTIVGDMVRGGVLVWIDRATVRAKVKHADLPNEPARPIQFPVDIYKLTDLGIAICEENGIEQT